MDPNEPVIEQPAQIEQTPPEDPGYTNEDLRKESVRDIAENTEEPTIEPEKPTEPETPIEEEIPVEKVIEDTTRKVLEEQEAKVIADAEAIKAEELAKTPQENEYATWEKQLWDKEKRTPTYTEALDFMSQQAEKRMEAKEAEKTRVIEEERVAAETKMAEDTQKINAVVDDELEDLYKGNILTRVKDANNPSDQGVVERKSLFAKWAEVNADRRTKNLPDILSATRIAQFYWQKPNAQPPGADAPIAGNRGSATPPSEEQEYSYKDLKKPWSFFGRGK